MKDELAKNLRFLCSHYKSISLVCRKLDINRTQFNRYLSGETKPSPNILKRISDFFGVEEFELALPHEQFVALLSTAPEQSNDSEKPLVAAEITSTFQSLMDTGYNNLLKYEGYYYGYQMSMTTPGKVLKSLVSLESKDGVMYYQRIERTLDSIDHKSCFDVYKGMVFFLGDRIFITDYSSSTKLEMSQTILFPSFKKNVRFLSGIMSGVSTSAERVPCSIRVFFEFIGRKPSVKSALKQCHFYDVTDPSLDKFIIDTIDNRAEQSDWQLRAKLI